MKLSSAAKGQDRELRTEVGAPDLRYLVVARGRSADEALAGADVFVGLSGPGAVTREGIESMADGAIVFAMANPTPEVAPEEIEGLAAVVATGRSDYPNQINNVLAFPGMFRGALDVRASEVTTEMELAAAYAIASSRLRISHSRHGAMTGRSGAKAM